MLDELQSDSSAVLRAADDLVPALYIPHDLDALASQLATLHSLLVAFRARLACLGLSEPPGQGTAAAVHQGDAQESEKVVRMMSSMTLQCEALPQIAQQKPNDKAISESKWINACFSHIFKSIDALKVA
jgi:hypothetical protein